MKKQFLIVCLLLLSLCSYAQTLTVKGTVTSASDKEPMIGLQYKSKVPETVLLPDWMVIIY